MDTHSKGEGEAWTHTLILILILILIGEGEAWTHTPAHSGLNGLRDPGLVFPAATDHRTKASAG